jgi:Fungal Zn(2)-Cys(6) binuclear cluster domain
MSTDGIPAERRYRSHLQPACLPCRKRKSRCKIDATQPATCLLCRFHGTDCLFPEREKRSVRASQAKVNKQRNIPLQRRYTRAGSCSEHSSETIPHARQRRGLDESSPVDNTPEETPFRNPGSRGSNAEDESHVVGPVHGPDAQRIADYLINDRSNAARISQLARSFSEQLITRHRPILFNAVRRRPLGTIGGQITASLHCKTIEKLLEPHCTDVIDL